MSASKPRLLVLTSTYPRWQGDATPGFVHELARRLTDCFEIVVLCPHARGAARCEIMDGVTVCRYRYAPDKWESLATGGIINNLKRAPVKWALVPLFLLAQTWATWRLIRCWRPNVIHAHWLIPQGLVVSILSILSGNTPPFLVTSHGADLHALRFWPMPEIKKFVARRAATVTVVSSSMTEVMKAQGISTKAVHVEPMGVDLEHRFTPDETVPRTRNEILFVGRLVEKKGLRYLIGAMPTILEEHPDAQLTVAGFGPEERTLRQQAEALDVGERIRFLGAVPQYKLPALYRRAAVFVAPFIEAAGGDQEGLGLVTVEAIGCGCPVVVSDLPAIRDVIENPDLLVAPSDCQQLATKVIHVLALSDEDKRSFGHELRTNLVERFDWRWRANDYLELLTRVLAR